MSASKRSKLGIVVSQVISRFIWWAMFWVLLVAVLYLVKRYEYVNVEDYLKSMEPTVRGGDWFVCDEHAGLEPGDIVWLLGERADFPARIIALEGQTVAMEEGRVIVDGEVLTELYSRDLDQGDNVAPVRVPRGHVFVLGDSRRWNKSPRYDSRLLGPIPRAKILGTIG